MIQMILGAKECVGEALASLRPPIPAWMETSFALDHVIQSGFYIHFTCKEGPYPDLKYKEYQEPGTCFYIVHTIRKVKYLSKNSILTKPQHFHEFFTQKFFDNFSREFKVVNS